MKIFTTFSFILSRNVVSSFAGGSSQNEWLFFRWTCIKRKSLQKTLETETSEDVTLSCEMESSAVNKQDFRISFVLM